MMHKIKIINGVRVLPLLYEKRYFKGAFIVAMIGLIGLLISLGRFIIYFDNSTNITETDVWELFVMSLFLFAMFLPTFLILYISHTIMKIMDTLPTSIFTKIESGNTKH